tara:strand:- start:107 stop:541 length:435 start_codon:yes stop_codon:yes gene_type:complete
MSYKNQLKNKTAYGSKLLKMNNSTYDLRRKVINRIYDYNNHLKTINLPKLPRIEVRIVSKCTECPEGLKGVAGYAYMNKKIIHIPEDSFKYTGILFDQLIMHEILHSIGFNHKKDCPVMNPSLRKVARKALENTFYKYLKKHNK